MAPLYLGLDVGTQGCKALVYDAATRRVVARGAHAYGLLPAPPTAPGRAEQHPDTWIDGVRAAARQALATPGVDAADVAAVGVSGQQVRGFWVRAHWHAPPWAPCLAASLGCLCAFAHPLSCPAARARRAGRRRARAARLQAVVRHRVGARGGGAVGQAGRRAGARASRGPAGRRRRGVSARSKGRGRAPAASVRRARPADRPSSRRRRGRRARAARLRASPPPSCCGCSATSPRCTRRRATCCCPGPTSTTGSQGAWRWRWARGGRERGSGGARRRRGAGWAAWGGGAPRLQRPPCARLDSLAPPATPRAPRQAGDASGTGLFDTAKRAWDPRAIDVVDPDLKDKLPPLLGPTEVRGERGC
jgi:hypothetical protein